MNKKHYINWERFAKDVKQLADMLSEIKEVKYCNLFPIPRGGLYVAAGLAYHLGSRLRGDLYCSSENIIVVDDISDTGKTLKEYVSKKRKVVTLHMKEGTMVVPTYCVRTFPRDIWVVYPWEQDLEGGENGHEGRY
jgi:hypoxanthine phosphoribosyltransferase